MTVPMLTREQAGAAVKAASGERDAIQANLLELDRTFGKQLLAGATLTGQTQSRWDAAVAALGALWQVYEAYSAVVDRAVETASRRLAPRDLADLTALLTGPAVQLATGPAPLAGRDLADTGRENLTLATAVTRMRRAFAGVTEVVSAAEQVWNEVAGALDTCGAELGHLGPAAAALGDENLTTQLAAAQTALARLRDTLNRDPLALWQPGPPARVDTAEADRLRTEVAAAAARAAELARLRDGAGQRIAALSTAAATARSAAADAASAWQRAAARITAAALPPPPRSPADMSARLAELRRLLDDGRWARLAAELEQTGKELAAATATARDAERTVMALLNRRDELRGLLDAYKAKSARLGAAEDPALAERYDHARDLLWTAPCDLTAADDAVTGYQQAVLALGGQRR
jgi:hypothetical protein